MAKRIHSEVLSHVTFDETLTLVRMHIGHRVAVELGKRLLETQWCRVLEIDEPLRISAWDWFVRYDDQKFLFTDCTSFALMQEMNIAEAFTFARRDFRTAGFVVVPSA